MITMTDLDCFREVADAAVEKWGFLSVAVIGHALEGPFADYRHFAVHGHKLDETGRRKAASAIVDCFTGPIEASAL